MAFNFDYLKKERAEDAIRVMKHAQDLRSTHRSTTNGYSKDKSMRHIMSFHPSVLFHPEWSKYFDNEQDPHERKKNILKFARLHPEYVVVDRV